MWTSTLFDKINLCFTKDHVFCYFVFLNSGIYIYKFFFSLQKTGKRNTTEN